MVIHVPINLYSVTQALAFLEEFELERSDTWLRNHMKAAKLKIYRIGNSDFITETDLFRISRLPQLKRGPKPKGDRRK